MIRLNTWQRFFACARGNCITNPDTSLGCTYVEEYVGGNIGPGMELTLLIFHNISMKCFDFLLCT